jgi:murein DD-endopeptidase MepM/ murein hydrolase activator NlpD
MIVGDTKSELRQFSFPVALYKFLVASIFIGVGFFTYISLDYIELIELRKTYRDVVSENRHLKGEARLLMSNLESAKDALIRVEDYAKRLDEIVSLRIKKISKKTGIGPLSKKEEKIAKTNSVKLTDFENDLPLGISIENLIFKPVLQNVEVVNTMASEQALNLQGILSTLQKRSHLLSTVPMAKPVDGWYASGFGYRISPFTGKRTLHRGLDIAAPVGTPIYAPADGVVIFSGAKSGFGKFIMIAHGHGIVTRYGHNAQLLVKPGERVKRGDQIATVGMTGRTTGPHLHYEVWVNGRPTNPNKFILSTSLALR